MPSPLSVAALTAPDPTNGLNVNAIDSPVMGPARSTVTVTVPVPGVSALNSLRSISTSTVVGTGSSTMTVLADWPVEVSSAEIRAVSMGGKVMARDGRDIGHGVDTIACVHDFAYEFLYPLKLWAARR